MEKQMIVERPPYYRAPRSRPVTFEHPLGTKSSQSENSNNQNNSNCCEHFELGGHCCPKVHVYIKHHHNHSDQGLKKEFTSTSTAASSSDMTNIASLPSYNNLPKPFSRSVANQTLDHQYHHNHHQHQDVAYNQQQESALRSMPPKILVNDQPAAYPSSTVHKSMLMSGSLSPSPTHQQNQNQKQSQNMVSPNNSAGDYNNNNSGNPNYTRLISPTLLTTTSTTSGAGSYRASSMSRNTSEMEQQQQQSKAPAEQSLQTSDFRTQSGNSSSGHESFAREAGSEYLLATLARRSGTEGSPKQREVGGPILVPAYRPNKNLDSNTVLPDSKRDEFMWDRQIERASIAHQNYRTLPIVLPKPKARHDLASGIYMRLSYDPTWDLTQSKPIAAGDHVNRRIQQAISSSSESLKSQVMNSSFFVDQQQTSCMSSGASSSAATSHRGPQQATPPVPCNCAAVSQHSCPTCPAHSDNRRIGVLAGGLNQQEQPRQHISPNNLSPAFNYREYIESTRRKI